ncbi:MAG TPA: Uma2 family endonuclease [Chloroflexota bacterium]|jgi:Uma2 family endonuclease
MSTETRFTVADLARMHLQPLDDTRYEIIDGELHVATQPSLRHQAVCDEVIFALRSWDPSRLHGRAFFAPGVIFAEDDTAAPDVAWMRRERFPDMVDDRGHLRAAPDLMVEVLSPGRENVRRDREKKLDQYSRFGVREYWIVDWRAETVDVHRHDRTALRLITTLGADDNLTSPLLPGFTVRVGDLCAPPA